MIPLLIAKNGIRDIYHKKYYAVITLLKATKAQVWMTIAKNKS
jgi:hypothetical protein